MRPKKETQKSARRATVTDTEVKGFTDEERVAMKERAQELKAEARRGPRAKKADGEGDVLAKIAEMPEPDRAIETGLDDAPALESRTTMESLTTNGAVDTLPEGGRHRAALVAKRGGPANPARGQWQSRAQPKDRSLLCNRKVVDEDRQDSARQHLNQAGGCQIRVCP